jgi:hypothetical protein
VPESGDRRGRREVGVAGRGLGERGMQLDGAGEKSECLLDLPEARLGAGEVVEQAGPLTVGLDPRLEDVLRLGEAALVEERERLGVQLPRLGRVRLRGRCPDRQDSGAGLDCRCASSCGEITSVPASSPVHTLIPNARTPSSRRIGCHVPVRRSVVRLAVR